MTSADYRIESSHPIASVLLPHSGSRQYTIRDRALAVAVAAKSRTVLLRASPAGLVVFRKQPPTDTHPELMVE